MSLSLTLWSVWPNFSGSTRNRQLAECPQQSEYTPALLLLHPHHSQCYLLLIPCFPQKALEPQDPAIGQPHKVPLSLLSSPSLSLISGPPSQKSDKTFPPKLEIQAKLQSRAQAATTWMPSTSSLSAKLCIPAAPVLPQLSSRRKSTTLIQPLLSP